MTLRTSMILTVPLLVMLVWSLFTGLHGQEAALDQALVKLNDLTAHESALVRDLLSARAGLLRNYDPVNREVSALDTDLAYLQETRVGSRVASALARSIDLQKTLIETFKSRNALLQNGLAYFGLFSNRLQAPSTSAALTQQANDLSSAMLQLTLDTSPDTVQAVRRQLGSLQAQPTPPELSDAVSALLAYGGLLSGLLPATDEVLTGVIALPFAAEEAAAAEYIASARDADQTRASRLRFMLYVTALLLLAQVTHFGWQLQRRRLAAQRRAKVERAVTSLSVRLINCGPDELPDLVQQALAQLAGLVRAERAYFVIADPKPQIYQWAWPSVPYPEGWPKDAVNLARQLPQTEHAVVFLPNRKAFPDGPITARLTEAGLQSWTCIMTDDQQKCTCLLGLDCLTTEQHLPELRLMRLAFDAITNAARRETMTRDRARLEEALQRARQVETITALTGGVAHNFNNIVGTILGYAEMIDETSVSGSRLHQLVSGIRQSGERARTLIEQILSYGKKRDRHRQIIDMQRLLAETIDQLALSMPSTARIVATDRTTPAATVLGEAAQLQQIIINLCNNAAQAMDNHGEISVSVDTTILPTARRLSHSQVEAGEYVRLTVGDRGRGISTDTLDRIFEPFFTTRAQGNGLGLATVRGIVLEHGGALHVDSTAGTGSRFEAWLPRAGTQLVSVNDAHEGEQRGNGETVLMIDDDPDRLLHSEEIIAALGYEPVGFNNATTLHEVLSTAPDRFDVAVLRLSSLPATVDLVRQLCLRLPQVPVIVVTAALNTLEIDSLNELEGCDVVPQSFSSRELAAALRRRLQVGGGGTPPLTDPVILGI